MTTTLAPPPRLNSSSRTKTDDAPVTISKDELEASICMDRFYYFVQRFWDIVVPEDPIWNWHIEEICDEMQKVAERVFLGLPKEYDLVINVPPGSTKSTICSVMFPAWAWTRMNTARCICGSYSYPLGLDLSRKSRDIVQSEKYLRLFPDLHLRADQRTKGYYVNEDGGYRFTTSTEGTVTGFHGHFIIIDDPLDPQEAVSEVELKRANDWMGSTLSTRKVDKAITVTILIMQRLHEDDPSATMVRRGKRKGDRAVRHINLPAEINGKNRKTVRPRGLRKKYVDGLLDPVRMDQDVLKEAQEDLGEYGYAGQFLQSPVPLEGGMFKVDKIQIKAPPSSFLQVVRFWDKAGTEGGGAYTAGVKLAEDFNNHYWILDVVREQLDSGVREMLVKATAILDGSSVIVGVEQEPGSGGKESAENTVRNLRGFITEVVRPTGDKRVRARPFSSQVNTGNVSMAAGLWNEDYIHELKLFDKGRYKDQVDASSGAFTVLTFPAGRIGVIKKGKK